MKKAFTMLELVVVIVIIGILATLGIQQYARMAERARAAEARTILGQIRGTAASLSLELGTLVGTSALQVGIGANIDQIPSSCRPTHYFSYAYAPSGTDSFTATATRCVDGGKKPQGATAGTLTLTTDFAAGTDNWGGSGGY